MLMQALRAARAADPPDWLIGGGVIRDLVWDHLHDPRQPSNPKDVDLVLFDPTSPGEDREQGVLDSVSALAPDIPWDVKNQAAVHLWYPQVFGTSLALETCPHTRRHAGRACSHCCSHPRH
jgi:uncharacterized protein